MDETILRKTYTLQHAIENDERVQRLVQKEKEMEEDEEVMVLSYHFSLAQNDYNDALRHFSEESEEVRKAQRVLFEKKKQLDEHPKVRAYLLAFQEVRHMYDQMQMDLFDPFIKHDSCHEKK